MYGATNQDQLMETIRSLREKRSLSRRRMAHVCGLSIQTVEEYERGTSAPRDYRRPLVALVLGVTTEELDQAIEATKRSHGGTHA